MIYFSIDLETTGLDPVTHGVTEFAAVMADSTSKEPPKAFYRWINPDGYRWSNYCLKLHADWIERVITRLDLDEIEATPKEPKICKDLSACGEDFKLWLKEIGCKDKRLLPTGKNFGSFDKQFLRYGFCGDIFRHRTLDWVPFYTRKEDNVPPELGLCKQRAIEMGCPGLKAGVAHNALDDARDVYQLIQFANGMA